MKKITQNHKNPLLFLVMFLLSKALFAQQLTVPYIFENNSRYTDEEIYIGLVGQTSELGDVWMNMTNSQLVEMSANDNTIPGPEWSSPADWLYPDIFSKLSDINNNTIQIPQGLFGCRIFVSFESPMYFHFHETGGYAGANLNSSSDPNDGIRWEIVELTWGDAGLWTNTSRVDAYQYPMAIEVTGFTGGVTGATYESSYNNAISGAGTPQYSQVGEVLSHYEILEAWDNFVSDDYLVAKIIKDHSIDGEPIIEQPSKVPGFPDDTLDEYIDEIWSTYADHDLVINIGDRGTWVGRVNANGWLQFTDPADGSIATIYGKPSSVDALEGAGFLAFSNANDSSVVLEDLMIQAQMAAAISRHAIYTDIIDGTVQFTHDEDRFFVFAPYNEYVDFFHNEDISLDSQTYAFSYDDVGDHSSTIQCTFPTEVKVIIGGYAEETVEDSVLTSIEITTESSNFYPNENINFTAQAYDQYGRRITTNVDWSASAGNISADGVFTSNSEGTFTITATQDNVQETFTFEVSLQPQTETCIGSAANGDFSYTVTNEANPYITFIPTEQGTGETTCILYYSTNPDVTFGGHATSANEAFQINASEGETVYFYYTYSLATGGERNTLNDIQSVTIGSNCTTATLGNESFSTNDFGSQIEVFPNPTHGKNTYVKGLNQNMAIDIFSLQGKLISTLKTTGVENIELETSNLSNGLYLITVNSLDQKFTKTFKLLVN